MVQTALAKEVHMPPETAPASKWGQHAFKQLARWFQTCKRHCGHPCCQAAAPPKTQKKKASIHRIDSRPNQAAPFSGHPENRRSRRQVDAADKVAGGVACEMG